MQSMTTILPTTAAYDPATALLGIAMAAKVLLVILALWKES